MPRHPARSQSRAGPRDTWPRRHLGHLGFTVGFRVWAPGTLHCTRPRVRVRPALMSAAGKISSAQFCPQLQQREPSVALNFGGLSQRHSRHSASKDSAERCSASLDPVDALTAGPFGKPCLRLSLYALSMRSRGHAARLFFVRAMNRQGTYCSCAHQRKPRPPAPPGRGQCQNARCRRHAISLPPLCSSDSPMPADGIAFLASVLGGRQTTFYGFMSLIRSAIS